MTIRDMIAALRVAIRDTRALTAAAFMCLLVGLVLPGMSVSASVMDSAGRESIATIQVMGLVGWLLLIVFAATLAARIVPALRPFTRPLDLAAVGCFGLGLLTYVLNLVSGPGTGDPVLDRLIAEMVSIYPDIGILPFVLSIAPILWAMRLDGAAPGDDRTSGEID